MMPFTYAIPVKFEGISIISLLLFTFLYALIPIFWWWNKTEHIRISQHSKDTDTEINEKVDLLFQKADQTNDSITAIKESVAKIEDSIDWIKYYIQKRE